MSDVQSPKILQTIRQSAANIRAENAQATPVPAISIDLDDLPTPLRQELQNKPDIPVNIRARNGELYITSNDENVEYKIPIEPDTKRVIDKLKLRVDSDDLILKIDREHPERALLTSQDTPLAKQQQIAAADIAERYNVDLKTAQQLMRQASQKEALEGIEQGIEKIAIKIPHAAGQETLLVRATAVDVIRDVNLVAASLQTKLESSLASPHLDKNSSSLLPQQGLPYINTLEAAIVPDMARPVQKSVLDTPELELHSMVQPAGVHKNAITTSFLPPLAVRTPDALMDEIMPSLFASVPVRVEENMLITHSANIGRTVSDMSLVNLAHMMTAQQVNISALVSTITPSFSEESLGQAHIGVSWFAAELGTESQPNREAQNILLSASHAGQIRVEVIGRTNAGDVLVQPLMQSWPSNIALSLYEPLSQGTTMLTDAYIGQVLDINAIFKPNIDTAIGQNTTAGSPAPQSLTPILSAGIFNSFEASGAAFVNFFEASIYEAMQVNLSSAQQLSASMPNLARPQSLPAAVLFIMAAFRGGDAAQLFSDKNLQALTRLSKMEDLSRINQQLSKGAGILRTVPEQGSSSMSEWRTMMFPLMQEAQIGAMALHWPYRDDRQDDGQADERSEAARFILDFNLSHMGDVQLDGFYKDRRLDIALKLETLPSQKMEEQLRGHYIQALDQADLRGDIKFQRLSEVGVRFRSVAMD